VKTFTACRWKSCKDVYSATDKTQTLGVQKNVTMEVLPPKPSSNRKDVGTSSGIVISSMRDWFSVRWRFISMSLSKLTQGLAIERANFIHTEFMLHIFHIYMYPAQAQELSPCCKQVHWTNCEIDKMVNTKRKYEWAVNSFINIMHTYLISGSGVSKLWNCSTK